MNDNKVTIIGVLFLALCLALAGGIYFLDGRVKILKEQYDELEQRRANIEQSREGLIQQIAVFKGAFSSLENYNVRPTSSDMNFYAQVQGEIDPYVRSNEMVLVSSRPNGIQNGRGSISLTLRGDYYSFMKILAAWRNLYTTVRVSQLSMTASRTPETRSEIQADVVLEAIVSAR